MGPAAIPVGRLSAAASAAVAGWLLASLPLLIAGVYVPVGWLLLCLPAAAAAAIAGWRIAEGRRWPLAPVVALGLVLVAFVLLSWLTASPEAIVVRDPGSYLLTSDWLAHHGNLRIPTDASLFGRAPVHFDSQGYYLSGSHLVPQFMSGWAALAAPAVRLGGPLAIAHAGAVLGMLGLLAVAALAARLAGPWTGVFAAALLASTMPMQHVSRDGLSEPGALVLLAAGLALLIDAMRDRGEIAWFAGGLLAGLAVMVRIDGVGDLIGLVPYAVWHRRKGGRSLAAGLTVGVGWSLLDGVVLSRPYLRMLDGQLARVAVAAVVLAGVAAWLSRRPSLPRWLPAASAALVALVGVALIARPLVQTVRRSNATALTNSFITAIQRSEGVTVDARRTYAEHATWWLAHWIGPVAAIVALLTLAVAAGRAWLRNHEAALLVLVALPPTALVLFNPSITPDHPWADRRLVSVALPTVTIAAAVGLRWLWQRARPRWLPAIAVVLGAGMLVEASYAGSALAAVSTERGEYAAMRTLCAAIPADAAVVTLGPGADLALPQAIRTICGRPVAIADSDTSAAVRASAAAVRVHGRQLIAVAESHASLAATGLTHDKHVVHLVTTEDDRTLEHAPAGSRPYVLDIWISPVR